MAQRVGRGIALLFHDRGTRTGEWSAVCPGRTSPPGKTLYPLYSRLGGRYIYIYIYDIYVCVCVYIYIYIYPFQCGTGSVDIANRYELEGSGF